MAIKFEKRKPGMRVYDNGHSLTPMGRRPATWEVRIESVDADGKGCTAVWNHYNAPRWYSKRQAEKWSAKPRKAKP